MKKQRRFVPSLAELVDRLSIDQLKEVFIAEHKDEYALEIEDIVHDIQMILDEEEKITAETIRAIVVLAQINAHIWYNESACRDGTGKGNLALTHGLNGIRTTAKNVIQDNTVDKRKDYKVDCLAAEFDTWRISW